MTSLIGEEGVIVFNYFDFLWSHRILNFTILLCLLFNLLLLFYVYLLFAKGRLHFLLFFFPSNIAFQILPLLSPVNLLQLLSWQTSVFPVKELSFIYPAFLLYPSFSTKACNKSSVGICVAFILFKVNFKLKCSISNLCLSCRFVCYLLVLLFFHLVCWRRSGEFGIWWLLLPYYEMVLNLTSILI